MYVPKSFEMHDVNEVREFINANSFGILMSTVNDRPLATHLPFIYDVEQNSLFAHMAKANPQWQDLHGQLAMAIFTGPHAYISPSWYEVPDSVPTWNYMAVHVYGKCSIIDDANEFAGLLNKMVRFFEPDSQLPSQVDEAFYQNMMKAIIGVRIDIQSIQGAAKLSQNKSADIQQRVIANLRQMEDAGAQAVAQLMHDRLL
jgi:transcriptional regulator